MTGLAAVRSTFQRWLYLPDEAPLLALLGTVAANLMDGDPVWLLLVGPPGSGKTELLESLRMVPGLHPAGTVTEAALLSGTPSKEKAKDAKGGLLREIGERGILVCKDFGSVLSMHRDERARVLAALREIYDGSWTRRIGSEGGRALSWCGHVGFVAGCPPTIDRHHAVMASLGERFVFLRLGDATSEAHTRKALAHSGRERGMRQDLANSVAELFADLRMVSPPVVMGRDEDRLVRLATLASRCRSAVERDGFSREIELISGPESPGRLALALRRLLGGLEVLGVERKEAWEIVHRVGLDSMPSIRRLALVATAVRGDPDTTTIAQAIGYPSQTTRRTLEDLAAHRVLERLPQGSGRADKWCVGNGIAGYLDTLPEVSGRAATSFLSTQNT